MNPLREHWTLDPQVHFLNHGSFGACPRDVLEYQQELRARLERQPVDFFLRHYERLLDEARERLAAFLGADPGALVAVPNATTAVNAVLRSYDLAAGDELLVTDHEYNASRNALDFVAERAGARVVVVAVPFPLDDGRRVVEDLAAAAGPRTRLALIDHVTSPTGMVLPLAEIVATLTGRGIDVLVDGAHGPGMLDLDLEALGATYYTGNCHKWLCAPKGAAFLHVHEERRESVRPHVISHGANSPRPGRSRYQTEFDWTGTDDPTAFLSVPRALDVLAAMVPGGWPEIRERNRKLCLRGREIVASALGVPAPCPEALIGSLAALPIPDGSPAPPESPLYADPDQQRLLDGFGVEVPILPWPAPPRRLLRISAALYNEPADYERLAEGLGVLFQDRIGV